MRGSSEVMKIAIPYENGEVFQHFGIAELFRVYTAEDGRVTDAALLEAKGLGHNHAGVAALLREAGVSVVLCGGIGAGAEQALAEAGLTLCSGVTGSADKAAQDYLSGTLQHGAGANCDHHHHHDEAQACGGGACGGCCGGCHSAPVSDYVETRTFTEIVPLLSENFEKEVLQDPGLICIDFWATWCGPCKMMAPIFEEVNAEQPRVKFCKVNVDEAPELAQLFGIESIPTVVLVQNRRTLTGFVGAQPKAALTSMIEEYLK